MSNELRNRIYKNVLEILPSVCVCYLEDIVDAALAATSAPAEPMFDYLSQTWVTAVAKECGVKVDRLSCLFDFVERVQRATRLATSAPSEPAEFEDECAANMNGHRFGPHGMRGERQCEWCGAAAPQPAPAVPVAAWGALFDPVYQALKDKDCLGASLALERVLSAIERPQPAPAVAPDEYRRGWDDAIAAHKLPYGAEVRQDHDWRPREMKEAQGEVTLPLAEFKRLVAAQPEAPAEPRVSLVGHISRPEFTDKTFTHGIATPPAEVEERRELSDAEIAGVAAAFNGKRIAGGPLGGALALFSADMNAFARAILAKSKEKAS